MAMLGMPLGVVDCGADRIDKALVPVIGGEIDGNLGLGRDGAGNLDIEHHFAVVGVGCGRLVSRMVYGDSGDDRHWHANLIEVELQVARSETSAELNDGDGLPCPVERRALKFSGKVIAFRELGCGYAICAAGAAGSHEPEAVWRA